MKNYIYVLIAIIYVFDVQANSNFIENPYMLYPPGCATLPDSQFALYGANAVKVYEQEIALDKGWGETAVVDANLTVYRVACAEPDRSVILFEFRIPDDQGPTYYRTPRVVASLVQNSAIGMELVREPNSWGVGVDGTIQSQIFGGPGDWEPDDWASVHSRSWIFVLENISPLNYWFWLPNIMTPSHYNSSFSLKLYTSSAGSTVIEVPSTVSVLAPSTRLPLSGRLSGTWVVDGAADQGFNIDISEMVPSAFPEIDQLADTRLNIFLSWYTFDADGKLLWLTGAQQFEMGASEVTVPIELVTGGQFMGAKSAQREIVGSVTLTGINCNDLAIEYKLDDIGLMSSTKHLQRIFSLEIAGYTCRDLEARILSR